MYNLMYNWQVQLGKENDVQMVSTRGSNLQIDLQIDLQFAYKCPRREQIFDVQQIDLQFAHVQMEREPK